MRTLYFIFLVLLSSASRSVEFNPSLLSDIEPLTYAPYSVASDSDSVPSEDVLGEVAPLSTSMTRDSKYVVFYSTDENWISDGAVREWFIKDIETYELKPLDRPSFFRNIDLMTQVKISPNGRYVGFKHQKDGPYSMAVWDRMTDEVKPAEYDANFEPDLGNTEFTIVYPFDERYVVLANNVGKLSITDLEAKTTKKINIDIYGNEAKPKLSKIRPFSDDGRYMVYVSFYNQMDPENVSEYADKEYALYIYDRVEDKHIKVASSKGEHHVFTNGWTNSFSISGNGKYVIYLARRPSAPEYSHYDFYSYYLVIYNINTKTYEYVRDINGELIQDIHMPSISNDAESIVFSTRNSDYLTKVNPGYDQVVYYDRVNQRMVQASISQRTGQASTQSVNPVVYANGKGVLWSGHGPGLLEGETNGHHLYIMGDPNKPDIPDICKPYIK